VAGDGEDLAAEPLLHQRRQTPAMVKMRVRGVLVFQFAAALTQAAIDRNPLAACLDRMAGAGRRPMAG
jgi:hypothetical protein